MELARLDRERGALEQEPRKARQRQQQLLTAPVTGAVQELAIHTVGGVVSAGEELMKIVPERATIEVEAMLQNRDIGFIREGQLAEVKVDTFNFTKYGLIDARVRISAMIQWRTPGWAGFSSCDWSWSGTASG